MCSRSTGWTFQVVIPASEMAAGVRRTLSGRASCSAGASGAAFAASAAVSASGAGGLRHAAPAAAGRQEEQQGSNALRGHVSYLQGSKSGPASRCTSATAKAWARCDSRRSRCASRKVRCASRRSRSEVSPSS